MPFVAESTESTGLTGLPFGQPFYIRATRSEPTSLPFHNTSTMPSGPSDELATLLNIAFAASAAPTKSSSTSEPIVFDPNQDHVASFCAALAVINEQLGLPFPLDPKGVHAFLAEKKWEKAKTGGLLDSRFDSWTPKSVRVRVRGAPISQPSTNDANGKPVAWSKTSTTDPIRTPARRSNLASSFGPIARPILPSPTNSSMPSLSPEVNAACSLPSSGLPSPAEVHPIPRTYMSALAPSFLPGRKLMDIPRARIDRMRPYPAKSTHVHTPSTSSTTSSDSAITGTYYQSLKPETKDFDMGRTRVQSGGVFLGVPAPSVPAVMMHDPSAASQRVSMQPQAHHHRRGGQKRGGRHGVRFTNH